MASSRNNITSLNVGMRSYKDINAQMIGREVSKHNYEKAIMSDERLQELRNVIYKMVSRWSVADKVAIINEYNDAGLLSKHPSNEELNRIVTETLIIHLDPSDLNKLYNDITVSSRKLRGTVDKIEKERRKRAKTSYNTGKFEQAYSSVKNKKHGMARNIKKALKEQGGGIKVPRAVLNQFKGLKKEVLDVLANCFTMADLSVLALQMGIEAEGLKNKELYNEIANKVLLFAATVLGKSKKVFLGGAILDEAPFKTILQYTSYSYIVGIYSDVDWKELKENAKRAQAMKKAAMKKKQSGTANGVSGLIKRAVNRARRGEKKGDLRNLEGDQLRDLAREYGIDPSKYLSVKSLRADIEGAMASYERKGLRQQKRLDILNTLRGDVRYDPNSKSIVTGGRAASLGKEKINQRQREIDAILGKPQQEENPAQQEQPIDNIGNYMLSVSGKTLRVESLTHALPVFIVGQTNIIKAKSSLKEQYDRLMDYQKNRKGNENLDNAEYFRELYTYVTGMEPDKEGRDAELLMGANNKETFEKFKRLILKDRKASEKQLWGVNRNSLSLDELNKSVSEGGYSVYKTEAELENEFNNMNPGGAPVVKWTLGGDNTNTIKSIASAVPVVVVGDLSSKGYDKKANNKPSSPAGGTVLQGTPKPSAATTGSNSSLNKDDIEKIEKYKTDISIFEDNRKKLEALKANEYLGIGTKGTIDKAIGKIDKAKSKAQEALDELSKKSAMVADINKLSNGSVKASITDRPLQLSAKLKKATKVHEEIAAKEANITIATSLQSQAKDLLEQFPDDETAKEQLNAVAKLDVKEGNKRTVKTATKLLNNAVKFYSKNISAAKPKHITQLPDIAPEAISIVKEVSQEDAKPVYVVNDFSSKIVNAINGLSDVHKQGVTSILTGISSFTLAAPMGVGAMVSPAALTMLGINNATDIASAAMDSAASIMLDKFTGAATGGKISSFATGGNVTKFASGGTKAITGDAMGNNIFANGARPELVTSTGSLSVTPLNKTGTETRQKISRMSVSERREALATAISSHVVKFNYKLADGVEDISNVGEAIKVYNMKPGIDDEIEVGGTTIKISSLLVNIATSLNAILESSITGSQLLSSVATATAATAANTKPTSGGNVFSGGGFPSNLDTILGGD